MKPKNLRDLYEYLWTPLHTAFSCLELGRANSSQFILPIFVFLVPQSVTLLDAIWDLSLGHGSEIL